MYEKKNDKDKNKDKKKLRKTICISLTVGRHKNRDKV